MVCLLMMTGDSFKNLSGPHGWAPCPTTIASAAPLQLVLDPGEELVRHDAVHPEQQEEHVGGRHHRLAPGERGANRAPLGVANDSEAHRDGDERCPTKATTPVTPPS